LARATDLPPPPSYQKALEQYQQNRSSATDAPKINEADEAIMHQAAEELAAQLPNPGLKVGETAPDFMLSNAFARPIGLYDELKKGPVVLSFYRGAWCPYCNLELRSLHASMPHFTRYGASLIAVTPQKPDKSLDQVNKDGYAFEILSDLNGAVMKAYKLYYEVPEQLSEVYKRNFSLDLAGYNGPGRYVLPVPGTFVIDTEHIIRAAYAEMDYKRRMEPADIIKALQEIKGSGE
jgi:peroxiredoxin